MNLKKFIWLFCLATACISEAPLALTFEQARHLLSRTSFSATAADINALLTLDQDDAVGQLIAATRTTAQTPAPEWVDEPLPERGSIRSMDDNERAQMRKLWRERGMELKTWWYSEMVATDSALTEKMTLFWHNHFTSSLRKVKSPQLMFRQNRRLREHALGSFGDLLQAIARDPAMLVYLDNHTNRSGNPNENFARELLELFTLGEGHYTEQDIKETARAFTGWGVDRRDGKHIVRPRLHDDGNKTVLGVSGRLDGNDVIEILLEHPQTSKHITEKLWREFVDDQPPTGIIESLAAQFRDNDYEIAPLLHSILTSREFTSLDNHGAQIKSPVELLVGTVRTLELPIREGRLLARAGRGLGQDLFDPPNVKGWPGGEQWITSDSLMNRQHILQRVVDARGKSASDDMGGGFLESWVQSLNDDLQTRFGVRSVLLALPYESSPNEERDLVSVVQDALLDPLYQLK